MTGDLPPPIPDYKIYKVDGIKSLEWTREKLAAKGLKDPWLRNEAWHYQHWTSKAHSTRATFLRGFKWAFAAIVLTVAIDKSFGISKSRHGAEHH